MPAAGRLGDKSQVPADAHGCPACPHPSIGPAIAGSPNVNVNARPALRVGDSGVHAACCGPNTWTAAQGAPGVFINSKAAHRMGDSDNHCGGIGRLIEGSGNVFIGNLSGCGGAAGPGGAGAIGSATGGVPDMGPRALRLSTIGAKAGMPGVASLGAAPVASRIGGIDAIVASSASFQLGTAAGLAQSLGTIAGEAALFGIAYGLGSAAGAIAGALGSSLADLIAKGVFVAAWVTLHVLPIYHGKTAAQYADYYFTNQFEYFFDGGGAEDFTTCPAPCGPPPVVDLKLKTTTAAGPWDVTREPGVKELLERFKPVVRQFADELDPMSIPEMMRHAVLYDGNGHVLMDRQWEGTPDGIILRQFAALVGSLSGTARCEIDDDFARGRIKVKSPRVHARAVWNSLVPDQLTLQYTFFRAGSYLPTKTLSDLAFEHSGDGESARVILARCAGDRYYLAGTSTGGHNNSIPCTNPGSGPDASPPERIPIELLGERPIIYIGHGSHAICPQPGKRRSKPGFFSFLSPIDWYPEADEAVELRYTLITSDDDDIFHAFYTKKVVYGGNNGQDHLERISTSSR